MGCYGQDCRDYASIELKLRRHLQIKVIRYYIGENNGFEREAGRNWAR